MSARLITVYGATGQQGGPIASALLASGFAVRAVTRNPDSEKAVALKKAGAEVVKGDLDDRSTIDAAVAGAYGVFLVTDYFDHYPFLHRVHDDKVAEEEEVAQGKAVADASARAGVKPEAKHIVHHRVPHYDGKAAHLSSRYSGYYMKTSIPFLNLSFKLMGRIVSPYPWTVPCI